MIKENKAEEPCGLGGALIELVFRPVSQEHTEVQLYLSLQTLRSFSSPTPPSPLDAAHKYQHECIHDHSKSVLEGEAIDKPKMENPNESVRKSFHCVHQLLGQLLVGSRAQGGWTCLQKSYRKMRAKGCGMPLCWRWTLHSQLFSSL